MRPAARSAAMRLSPKTPWRPTRAEAIGVARPILDAGIDEFLLEGGDQLEPARLVPGLATARRRNSRGQHSQGLPSVLRMSPRKKCSRRRAVAEIDIHLGARIGHDHEIAAGAERRIEDRPEAGLHQIGVGPADAGLLPRLQLARRKALAAHHGPAMSQVPTKISPSRSNDAPFIFRPRQRQCTSEA